MNFEIVDSSPAAKAITAEHSNKLYPFDRLEVGQSFTAKLDECNWKSIRTCVYQRNARDKTKLFQFLKHDELGVCEVARIA